MDRLRSYYHRLPTDVRNAILVHQRTSIWLRAGIVFVHIPRTAGTSINVALYDRFMGHPRASDIRRWGSAALKSLPSFAITRNPWGRLVSAYRFARRGGGVGGAFEAGMFEPQRYQGKQFETFERFVREWLLLQDPRKVDGVFQPQSTFVRHNGKLLVDHVGRLENLEPTLDFIEAATGKRPEVPQGNRSGDYLDFRQVYTPELAELVGHFYHEDVCSFGYAFDRS